MPPSNRIHTIRDLTASSDGNQLGTEEAASEPHAAPATVGTAIPNHPNKDGNMPVFHIPTLPQADQAKSLLDRVVGEFLPIVQRRGYSVKSISELCCCNDGLDFDAKRRRKLRKVANNIWGYNQITFWRGSNKTASSTIHLRLRHPGQHGRLLPYEDVAGTLAHELAHCEHRPHNQHFYKLMDEILEEHAVLMAGGLTRGGGKQSMPAFGGAGHVLGRAKAPGGGEQQPHPFHNPRAVGKRLGGDPAFQQWMTPAEAAVAAAEARRRAAKLRLRGDHCCRPCNVDDDDPWQQVVEIDDKGDCKPAAKDVKQNKREADVVIDVENWKPNTDGAAVAKVPSKRICVVDLTIDDDEEDGGGGKKYSKPPPVTAMDWWACGRCTLRNKHTVVTCAVCQAARTW